MSAGSVYRLRVILASSRRIIRRLLVPVNDLHGSQDAGVLVIRDEAALLHAGVHGPHGLDACRVKIDGVRLVEPVARGHLEKFLQALVQTGWCGSVMDTPQFVGDRAPLSEGQHNMSHEIPFQITIAGAPDTFRNHHVHRNDAG